jgi:hypothetical protein
VDQEAPPGLFGQARATFDAVKRLIRAHVALGRAEAADILDEVKRVVAFGFAALALVIVVAQLLLIGGLLFVGDWLFGSIGWGVLLGSLLLIDVAAVLVLAALGTRRARLGQDLVVAAAIGLVAGVVLGLDLTHRGWSSLADSVAGSVDPAWRTVLVAIVALALIGAVIGLISGIRSGSGAAVGGAIGLAVLGAVVGWITALSIPMQVGAALGVLVGLIAWPALSGLGVARHGIDTDALKAKFTPDETIDETKETIEWVRARLPLAPKS